MKPKSRDALYDQHRAEEERALARRRTRAFANALPENERAVVIALMEELDAVLVDESEGAASNEDRP